MRYYIAPGKAADPDFGTAAEAFVAAQAKAVSTGKTCEVFNDDGRFLGHRCPNGQKCHHDYFQVY